MIEQVHGNINAVDETSIGNELAATEGFEMDETPRPAAARCTGCAGVERVTDLCVDCYVSARG